MGKIVRIIGSIIVAALLYAIPILTTCAFIFSWSDFTTFLLTFIALAEFACLGDLVYDKAKSE